ncbi:glycoside hydrolase family 113 [Neolewinella sp.]|uniref:glycoside hydrolase family 113 n=1 Tax=Neolewinella sp. TaxID=2993543 RepID=UPI003B524C02
MQRANLRASTWQLIVCSADSALLGWARETVRQRPRDKNLVLRECADYDPTLPALVVGTKLPEGLGRALGPTLDDLGYTVGEHLVIHNLLSPLNASDTMPVSVSLRIGEDPSELVRDLRRAATENWWSIFSGQWAYEITASDGTLRLGDYESTGWSYDRQREIVLPPPGKPVRQVDTLNFYALDGASPDVIDSLLPRLEAYRDSVPHLREVFLYPSVERIGLRRGDMAAVQFGAGQLHLVADQLLSTTKVTNSLPSFYAGMTFAHEGYRVYNGYGGSEVAPSLDSLMTLNINAVSIVPYTYMPAADRVGTLPIPTDAGSENDGAVIYSIRQAQARDLAVLLKPQIWVGGAWPGQVDFATAAEWDHFFTTYERWITHYARMAEREGVAALCIGTELVQATLKHPDRWRELIARLRKVYSGQLTYAANWGQEFENISFWRDLDVIGLNSYYPLAGTASATDVQLTAAAARWMHLADSISTATDRPLWLTEVGYRSVAGAWINPHAEAADRPASVRDQERSYRALLTAASASSRLTGMFVWKWPSYLGYADRWDTEDRGYTPGGKPAAELLRDFYLDRTLSNRE